MVSALSSRLMGTDGNISCSGGSSSDGSSFSRSRKHPRDGDSEGGRAAAASVSTRGGSSGYAADLEGFIRKRSPPPVSIDLKKKQPSKRASYSAHHIELLDKIKRESEKKKKQKMTPDELSHAAHTAKEALEKGGLSFAKVQPHRPRVLPSRSGVDLTTVELLYSHKVEKKENGAPLPLTLLPTTALLFTAPRFSSSTESDDANTSDFSYEWPIVLPEMIQACAHLYKETPKVPDPVYDTEEAVSFKNPPSGGIDIKLESPPLHAGSTSVQQQSADDGWSDTSSVTESEETYGATRNYLQPPVHKKRKKGLVVDKKKTNPVVMTIGDALMISQNPRLTALSAPPFQIVQANAAFHRFSGCNNSKILGESLAKLLPEESLVAVLRSSVETGDKVTLDGNTFLRLLHAQNSSDRSTDLSSIDDDSQKVVVSPVGPDSNTITHFSLELLDWKEGEEVRSRDPQQGLPLKVVA